MATSSFMSSNNLYESFSETLTRGLNEKYRYLRHNTTIHQNYPFRIEQIREASNQHDENGRLMPPHLNGFGFSGPDEPLVINMLLRYQDETHYIRVNLNTRTFSLTEQGIRHLRELDSSLE